MARLLFYNVLYHVGNIGGPHPCRLGIYSSFETGHFLNVCRKKVRLVFYIDRGYIELIVNLHCIYGLDDIRVSSPYLSYIGDTQTIQVI